MTDAPAHRITGKTRIYGILADPIHHVKTPEVMAEVFARHGVDAVLIPFHVQPEGLVTLVSGLKAMENFGGFIATVPHKPDMLGLCDGVTEEARNIGAVNCVRREADGRMVGTMLDGIGFVVALRTVTGFEPEGKRAYVAGAGVQPARSHLRWPMPASATSPSPIAPSTRPRLLLRGCGGRIPASRSRPTPLRWPTTNSSSTAHRSA